MPKIKNLLGNTYGRLTVIAKANYLVRKGLVWTCKCTCGNIKDISSSSLRTGKTQSCGCLAKEITKKVHSTHGLSKTTDEYSIWSHIKQRIYNVNDTGYKHYGAKKITMSKEWTDNFTIFYKDMGKRPSKKHSVERINNNKGYYKNNCKWATHKEQSNNRSNNHTLTYNGKTQTIALWEEEYGIINRLFRSRVQLGWSDEKIISTPQRTKNEH